MANYISTAPAVFRKDRPPAISPRMFPPNGWVPGIGDRPCMVKHNGYGNGVLKFSNETVVAEEYDRENNRIIPGKVTVQLGDRFDWQAEIERMNGPRIFGLWIQKLYGFCDGGDDGTGEDGARIPYLDPIPFRCSIDVGGNRRNCKEIILKSGNKYAVVETQNWGANPFGYDYETEPHITVKQVDASNDDIYPERFWRTSPQGDVVWPWVAD